jgi:hypothetical protein
MASNYPVKKMIPNAKSGFTFSGYGFQIIVNNSPVDLTNAVVTLQLISHNDSSVVYTMTTTAGTLSVPTPTNGTVMIIPQTITYTPDRYDFLISCYWPITTVNKPYIYGTWVIE